MYCFSVTVHKCCYPSTFVFTSVDEVETNKILYFAVRFVFSLPEATITTTFVQKSWVEELVESYRKMRRL